MSSALRGRMVFRLVLMAAVVALVAVVMTTARAESSDEAGAQPDQTGSFKIIKTHPGFPQSDVVDDMFQFDVECSDTNGREIANGGPVHLPG